MRVNSPSSESAKAVASSLMVGNPLQIVFHSAHRGQHALHLFHGIHNGLGNSITMRWCKLRASCACQLYGTRGSG